MLIITYVIREKVFYMDQTYKVKITHAIELNNYRNAPC